LALSSHPGDRLRARGLARVDPGGVCTTDEAGPGNGGIACRAWISGAAGDACCAYDTGNTADACDLADGGIAYRARLVGRNRETAVAGIARCGEVLELKESVPFDFLTSQFLTDNLCFSVSISRLIATSGPIPS
jgi:hypothetical protein